MMKRKFSSMDRDFVKDGVGAARGEHTDVALTD